MNLPLQGIRIADFSWVGAGPRATKDLADLGATVVKIESRKRLDLGRLSPPFAGDRRDPDGSAFFAITNTSKMSVTINLGDPEGVEVAKKLVAWADVVVENFSAGYMDRIGLSYETLKAVRPGVILVSVSVAGRSGPLGSMRGYGNSAAALSGLAAMSGWPDRDPHMPPFAYGDVVAPMFATVAVLAALEHRRRTGEGQHVDVSQVEPLVHTMADVFLRQQLAPSPKPGNRSHRAAPHGAFRCRGHNQYVAIAVDNDRQWQALARLSGIEDSRFDTLDGRIESVAELEECVDAWTRRHDKHILARRLCDSGIPCEPVADGRDVFTDPELVLRGHYRTIRHAKLGECAMPAPPLRFSDGDIRVEPPPCLGEHLETVLVDMLGMGRDEVRALVDSGALT